MFQKIEFFKKLLVGQNSVVKLMGNFVLGLFVSFYKAWKSKINLRPCEPHCGHWVRNLGGFKGLSTPNLVSESTIQVLTNSFQAFWPQVKRPNSLGHTVPY